MATDEGDERLQASFEMEWAELKKLLCEPRSNAVCDEMKGMMWKTKRGI